MHRERLTEDIYVFTSSRYVDVTATVIFTRRGVVVFDTLPFPDETRQMRAFIEQADAGPIRYVILSHSHADHVYGAFLFPEAEVIGHRKCYELLEKYGRQGLEEAKRAEPELAEVTLRLPGLWVEEEVTLRMESKTITLFHSPGHTPDVIAAYIHEDRTLLASDTMMPIPHVADGDPEALIRSLQALKKYQVENLVQGHGEILLRGEIVEHINRNIAYLRKVTRLVSDAVRKGTPLNALLELPLESFGIPRIALGGLAKQIHYANLQTLYYREQQRLAHAQPAEASATGTRAKRSRRRTRS